MATRRCKMVTYLDRNQPVKSHDPLITWSCKIMWQTKTTIFPLSVPMVTKLDKMVTYLDGLLPIKSHLWSWGLKRSHSKLKYISTTKVWAATKLGRMITYLDGLQPKKPNDPFWLLCGLIKSRDKLKAYISTIIASLATKGGGMVTYLDVLLPITSNNPLITWSFEITWQIKIISLLPQRLRPSNLSKR